MIPKRLRMATFLLVLAPASAGFGSWLIFQAGIMLGSGVISATNLAETTVGTFLFVLALPLFFPSLGALASTNNMEAERWLRWLGTLRPKFANYPENPIDLDRYRLYTLTILLTILVLAILLIPGIGEDRQYPLNQFYGFIGSLWYAYAFAVGIAGFLLIYKRRPGGYVLGLLLGIIAIGTNITDLLGLQPPSAPTLRTSILELASVPPSFLLAYVSLKALRTRVFEKPSEGQSA